MGQKLFKLEVNRRIPPSVNAAAGAVINSTRTSLDLLAASLARRNGKTPNADRHFPIYASIMDFIDPQSETERKKWLSDADRQVIEGLKPYFEGNDTLFALHKLDITRKHDRLIRAGFSPTGFYVHPEAYAQGMGFPNMWPGFDDGAVVAWTHINATNTEFQVTADVTINEAGAFQGKPLVASLRQFNAMANSIVQLFG